MRRLEPIVLVCVAMCKGFNESAFNLFLYCCCVQRFSVTFQILSLCAKVLRDELVCAAMCKDFKEICLNS